MKLDYLDVSGELRGASAHTPINVQADNGIYIHNGAVVGGSNPDAGGSDKEVPVTLDSGGLIFVGGKVEANGGNATLTAKDEIIVTGIVNSWGGGTTLKSDTSSVTLEGEAIVAGDGTVEITSGNGKPTVIECRVQSRQGDVVINNNKKRTAGNVTIGKADTVMAANEVLIAADTLIISGTIIANTVQKFAKVTLLDSTGSITNPEGRPLKLTNKIDTLYATRERTDGRVGEEANHCCIIAEENATIDFRGSPSAIDADSTVKISAGPGGTIDFRGNWVGWPVIQCPGPITLKADNILTDPWVPLESICGPGPLIVGASEPVKLVTTGCVASACGYPGRDSEVKFLVRNMGTVDDTYIVTITDNLGWPSVASDYMLDITSEDVDSIVAITFSVPPEALPNVDTNVVTVQVASQTDPSVVYEETTYIDVHDLNCLRDFSLNPWDIGSGHPEDTALVDYWVMNINELDDSYDAEIGDSLGWECFGPGGFSLPMYEDTIVRTRMVIPGTSFDGEVNKLYVTVRSLNDPENVKRDTIAVTVGATTSVDDEAPPAPGIIRHTCYPNPFNPSVTFRFSIPESRGRTSIEIFDLNGRSIKTMNLGRLEAREHSWTWDGRAASGSRLASGVYFYRIRSGSLSAAGKLVLAR